MRFLARYQNLAWRREQVQLDLSICAALHDCPKRTSHAMLIPPFPALLPGISYFSHVVLALVLACVGILRQFSILPVPQYRGGARCFCELVSQNSEFGRILAQGWIFLALMIVAQEIFLR